jgi:hypothetical protein
MRPNGQKKSPPPSREELLTANRCVHGPETSRQDRRAARGENTGSGEGRTSEQRHRRIPTIYRNDTYRTRAKARRRFGHGAILGEKRERDDGRLGGRRVFAAPTGTDLPAGDPFARPNDNRLRRRQRTPSIANVAHTGAIWPYWPAESATNTNHQQTDDAFTRFTILCRKIILGTFKN